MIKVKNPNQLNIFDPWDFLTPKRRQMLDAGWPGLFREHILPSIPIDKVKKYFSKTISISSTKLSAKFKKFFKRNISRFLNMLRNINVKISIRNYYCFGGIKIHRTANLREQHNIRIHDHVKIIDYH